MVEVVNPLFALTTTSTLAVLQARGRWRLARLQGIESFVTISRRRRTTPESTISQLTTLILVYVAHVTPGLDHQA
jgi:hypothetical protein